MGEAQCVLEACGPRERVNSTTYRFEYLGPAGQWLPAAPDFVCSTTSVPNGNFRMQTAELAIPGSDGCEFIHIYDEDQAGIERPHRLHLQVTTNSGVDISGVSLPWPMVYRDPCCP